MLAPERGNTFWLNIQDAEPRIYGFIFVNVRGVDAWMDVLGCGG